MVVMHDRLRVEWNAFKLERATAFWTSQGVWRCQDGDIATDADKFHILLHIEFGVPPDVVLLRIVGETGEKALINPRPRLWGDNHSLFLSIVTARANSQADDDERRPSMTTTLAPPPETTTSTRTMRATVFHGVGDIRVEEVPDRAPAREKR